MYERRDSAGPGLRGKLKSCKLILHDLRTDNKGQCVSTVKGIPQLPPPAGSLPFKVLHNRAIHQAL